MAKETTVAKPVGRPPKKVRVILYLDPKFGHSNPKIDVEAKKADELIADVVRNGYTFRTGDYTQTLFIEGYQKKEL